MMERLGRSKERKTLKFNGDHYPFAKLSCVLSLSYTHCPQI